LISEIEPCPLRVLMARSSLVERLSNIVVTIEGEF
jgi:hypothetical protein